MTSKADKLPLETEPVARDNNTIFMLKPGDQTLSRLTQLIIVVSNLGFLPWFCSPVIGLWLLQETNTQELGIKRVQYICYKCKPLIRNKHLMTGPKGNS